MQEDVETTQNNIKITDFFLANDIIQGEEVPFYILWEGGNPDEIQIEIEGFKALVEVHNSDINKAIIEGKSAIITDFQVDGYLGGVLSTELTNDYYFQGRLKVHILKRKKIIHSFDESRTIFSTITKVTHIPSVIDINDKSEISDQICLTLEGKTTVFFEIDELEDNYCNIDIPPDVKEELNKLICKLSEGMEDLKSRFPDYSNTIDIMLQLSVNRNSMTSFIEEFDEKLNEAMMDENFVDALVTLFTSVIFSQNSLEKLVLKPLNEYFETYSINKAFFSNPLLNLTVPCGSCQLAIKIITIDLLNQECSSPIQIRTVVNSDKENSIPIRDLLSIKRCLNG